MISKIESNIIRYIRSFALFSIIACHFLQVYNNKWAWVLNVGVQIFLAISGYLYGNKNIVDWSKWFKDKIKKLYIPYIIYIILIFPIYQLFTDNVFNLRNLLVYICDLQWILGSVEGLAHLWFMTAIALCYTLTPFLQKIRNKVSIAFLALMILGILNIMVLKMFLGIFSVVFIYCFTYLYVSLNEKQKNFCTQCMIGLFILLLLIIDWRIILDYTNNINKLFHIILGLLCVIVPMQFLKNCFLSNVSSFILKTDEYSYFVYITHHVFILGPLSIAFLTNSIYVNVIIILFMTIISSVLLKIISNKITGLIE